MEDNSNIFNSNELTDDQLEKYLSGKTGIAKNDADNAFGNDAAEGLKSFSSTEKLNDYVSELNKKLHHQLETKKQRKDKRSANVQPWIIFAVILILLLCVLAFFIIKMKREEREDRNSIKAKTQTTIFLSNDAIIL